MNILLIGSGRTGRAIAENLLDIKNIKKLFLYSRTPRSSKSLALDLDHPKATYLERLDYAKNIDVVIIAFSGMSDTARNISLEERKTTYEIRQDELKYNLGILVGLIPTLQKLPAKTKIIVVTNPVDEITNYLYHVLGKKKIFGFGMQLDVQRYASFLKHEVVCVGTHGAAIPLLNLHQADDYKKLSKKIDAELFAYVKKHGIPHRNAGLAFKDFFQKIISPSSETIFTSYWIDKKFYGVQNIAISLPFIIKKGTISKIAPITLSKIEAAQLQKDSKRLKQSLDHIMKGHKNLKSYR